MRRRVLSILAFGLLPSAVGFVANAQAPVFSGISGKWEGMSATGSTISLEIDAAGKFSIATARGTDSGTAKAEGETIILAFTKNPGNVRLTKKGDVLDGTVTLGNSTNAISFKRKS